MEARRGASSRVEQRRGACGSVGMEVGLPGGRTAGCLVIRL